MYLLFRDRHACAPSKQDDQIWLQDGVPQIVRDSTDVYLEGLGVWSICMPPDQHLDHLGDLRATYNACDGHMILRSRTCVHHLVMSLYARIKTEHRCLVEDFIEKCERADALIWCHDIVPRTVMDASVNAK